MPRPPSFASVTPCHPMPCHPMSPRDCCDFSCIVNVLRSEALCNKFAQCLVALARKDMVSRDVQFFKHCNMLRHVNVQLDSGSTFFTMRKSTAVSATTVELWFAAGTAMHQCQVLVGGCTNHHLRRNHFRRPAAAIPLSPPQCEPQLWQSSWW